MSNKLCTSCQKSLASVHVLDLTGGMVAGEQNLCQACAESKGVVQPKVPPKAKPMSAEILEDLIGAMATGEKGKARGRGTGPACPACQTTAADFKVRGRFGCPRCYETFRMSLVPLLERVHDNTKHQGRCPTRTATVRPRADMLADLRRRLDAAIQDENYEEAAALRDQLRSIEQAPSAGAS